MSEHKLIVLCGKSGCGKTTIANALSERYGLKQIESYTTRPKRYENEYGHEFINKHQFSNLKADLVAYTMFDEYEYGTTTQQIESNDIYIVDVDGIKFLRDNYNGKTEFIIIGIDSDIKTLIDRMTVRGDMVEKINQRLKNDAIKFKDLESEVQYLIVNDNLESTINQIYDIYKKRGGCEKNNEE